MDLSFGIDVWCLYMVENEIMVVCGGEDCDFDEIKVEVVLRKLVCERKLNLKYVSFFDDLYWKGLKDDLEKYVKVIEMMFNKIFCFDVIVNCEDV